MRRIRIAGLCLGAVLVSVAVGVSSASAALPEYYEANVAHVGSTEFTGAGGVAKLEGGFTVECAASTSKGKVKNAKEVRSYKIIFTGCHVPSLPGTCQTSAVALGVIKTKPIRGELVYSTETLTGLPVASLLLESQTLGQPWAKFTCGPKRELKFSLTGRVLAAVEPLNVQQGTGEVALEDKVIIAGCGRQRLLFVTGVAPCEHLSTTGTGTAWLVARETLTYVGATLEVRG